MDTSINSLATLLKNIRIESGLTQKELAAQLNKPQSFVSKYEIGERRLTFDEVVVICQGLNIPLTEFILRYEACRDQSV